MSRPSFVASSSIRALCTVTVLSWNFEWISLGGRGLPEVCAGSESLVPSRWWSFKLQLGVFFFGFAEIRRRRCVASRRWVAAFTVRSDAPSKESVEGREGGEQVEASLIKGWSGPALVGTSCVV